ncbi:hypothetical protein VIGAN_09024500, partial [Vigna angularis var. angularis]
HIGFRLHTPFVFFFFFFQFNIIQLYVSASFICLPCFVKILNLFWCIFLHLVLLLRVLKLLLVLLTERLDLSCSSFT